MYTTTLNEIKIYQNELFRQAENYRLVKLTENKESSISRFISNIGKTIDQLLSL